MLVIELNLAFLNVVTQIDAAGFNFPLYQIRIQIKQNGIVFFDKKRR